MKIAYYILSGFIVLTTLIPFIPSTLWWVRIFEFPRYQFIFIGLISIILFFFIKKDIAAIIFLAAVIISITYHSIKVLPYTFFYKKQVEFSDNKKTESNISFVLTNVLMDNNNYQKLIEIIRRKNPDLVFLAEANQTWYDNIKEIEKDYPYVVHKLLDNTYGMALFSKFKLHNSEVKFLVEKEIPSIHTLIELKNGKKIKGYFVHPKPPAPQEATDAKEQIAELLIVGKEAKKSEYPAIVAGDLNDVAWSETTSLFQKISGLLDPRVGRDFYNTFHADYYLLRWPLDYIFHSKHFKLVGIERLEHFGSDHFPMYISIQLQPENPNEPMEKPDSQEKEKVNELIEKGTK